MSTENDSQVSLAGQYLTFQLRSELFGMPIKDVREINQHGEVTPLPHAPKSVKGVMNLRGKIIPVVNLRLKFGMEEQALTRDSCIIVIDTEIGQVGMVVDSVKEVMDLENAQIERSPSFGHQEAATFIKGMGKIDSKVLILVDVKAAFSPEDAAKIKQAESSEAKAA